MPYDAFQRGEQWCVYKLGEDRQPQGDTLGCHDSEEQAKEQIRALYASEAKEHAPDALKAVAYVTPRPLGLLERFKTRQRPGVTVFKRGDSRYMFIVTSNSYQDREREYITSDALKNYVERAWVADDVCKTGNVLLFWHEDEHVGPIGDIIWADMEGPFLVEVAKERATEKARLIWDYIEAQPEQHWGASHGFRYEKKVLGTDGTATYQDIEKFETSVLPLKNAANPYTFSGVIMPDERDTVLEKIGIPITALRKSVGALKKRLDEQGVEHKEADKTKGIVDSLGAAIDTFLAKVTDSPAPGLKEELMAAIVATLATAAPEEETPAETTMQADATEMDEEERRRMAEMTGKQIKLLDTLTTSQAKIVESVIDLDERVKALAPMNDLQAAFNKMEGRLAAVEKQLAGRPRAASTAPETVTAPDQVSEAIKKQMTKHSSFWGTTIKEER